ncbi:antitoxin [candidate division KSB1 bacterium 4572_119]|nr:MAG: antitoxin [candidate division KSB1 bacterium 4572_119]
MNNLTNEERDILESFERGEWKSVPNIEKRKEDLKQYSRATLRKDKRVNIRISERDLKELQRKAVHEGLPYQTFISSILHKFVNGNLLEHSAKTSS